MSLEKAWDVSLSRRKTSLQSLIILNSHFHFHSHFKFFYYSVRRLGCVSFGNNQKRRATIFFLVCFRLWWTCHVIETNDPPWRNGKFRSQCNDSQVQRCRRAWTDCFVLEQMCFIRSHVLQSWASLGFFTVFEQRCKAVKNGRFTFTKSGTLTTTVESWWI